MNASHSHREKCCTLETVSLVWVDFMKSIRVFFIRKQEQQRRDNSDISISRKIKIGSERMGLLLITAKILVSSNDSKVRSLILLQTFGKCLEHAKIEQNQVKKILDKMFCTFCENLNLRLNYGLVQYIFINYSQLNSKHVTIVKNRPTNLADLFC